jgi:hypothetical protein
MPKIFGREPALWLALVAIIVKTGTAFGLHLSVDQQSAINAVAAAAIGLIVARIVHNGAPAAILGLTQAVIALAVGFGLHLGADQQALLMSLVSAVVSLVVRALVTAPVPAASIPAAGVPDVTGG